MDVSFEMPDFANLHKLMDEESQKNIDNEENSRVKKIIERNQFY
tara:strand:- start:654 stop:785 length:132 start_codon:yes stop_codon:yes gene_type:complete